MLCAGVLLAGCSDTADDQPTAKSGGDASAAAVDPAALDTGSYPTSPAPEFGRATDATIVEVEGQRLAEFTIVPFEIDAQLTSPGTPGKVLRSGKEFRSISSEAADILANDKMLYGYQTNASTPTATNTDPSKSVLHAVLRFNNAQDAAKAAREIHTQLTTVDTGAGVKTPETIDILPNTLVSTSESRYLAGPEVSVNAFTPHGDYLIYTWAKAPAAEKDWTAKTVAKALDLQAPLIDKFPAQPTKEQNGGKTAERPMMDQGKVLIYAIPEQDAMEAQFGDDMAAYGPRGMAHRSINPPLTYRVLTETGSQHNAVAKTVVYRAKDDAGAQRIFDEWINDLKSQGFADAPSPQGLSNATCVTQDTVQGTADYCLVVKGRYVGEAHALDNKKDADQQISAQYLILEKANQNA
ncbi:hypothetical protein FK531_00350 [Rhodococcus spelaei]|uniref:Uncharacterized protein n=1 Tax=Rhodococcus spelaei TaxID=2546320 RepID=A0A541BSD0_9NOCA|nr:hypothetical protein FK531_00350 [Rhodococcus spelaei]